MLLLQALFFVKRLLTIIAGRKGCDGRHVIPVLLDFSLTVKAAPHECVIRTIQP